MEPAKTAASVKNQPALAKTKALLIAAAYVAEKLQEDPGKRMANNKNTAEDFSSAVFGRSSGI